MFTKMHSAPVSSRHGSSDPSRRPAKRQRISRSSYQISPAAAALLERVEAIRSHSLEIRDEHQALIDDYDRRAIAKRAASKAAARIQPSPPCPEVVAFSKGDAISSGPSRRQGGRWKTRGSASEKKELRGMGLASNVAPVPALSLLAEPDPPEKCMVEQSVIWRAHMINRKNAELARERLPKQPEAQRGKTHWDYVLDEALWLANDYREEHKWKVQVAKKVSKMVMQYHAHQAQRIERAMREEEQRLIRLAHSIARGVRKFWNQIHELADYRLSVVRDARVAAEREEQLKSLLEQTEAYTNVVARNLQSNTYLTKSALPARVEYAPICPGEEPTAVDKDALTHSGEALKKRSRQEFESSSGRPQVAVAVDKRADIDRNVSDDEHSLEDGSDAAIDDERTLAEDEAGDEADPQEIERLKDEADLTLEQLLRRQGIDPDAYARDSQQYVSSSSGSEYDSGPDSSSDQNVSENMSDEIVRPQVRPTNVTASDNEAVRDQTNEDASASSIDARILIGKSEVLRTETPLSNHGAKDAIGASKSMGQQDLDVAMAEYVARGEPLDVSDGEDGTVQAGQVVFKRNVEENASDQICTDVVDQPAASGARDVRSADQGRATGTLATVGESRNLQRGPSMREENAPASKFNVPLRLLHGSLRDYQHIGMEWLVTLYHQKLNGILADEMGLGKTIQTIALLAWLAVERGVWGPHLVVVPTSVMINWEVEFKKWLPGFKILTYYGSMKERRAKRRGWSKPNTFHVCITSYSLVVQDASALRRKKWVYLILDEAHNIKNFQSQRWQTLLNFPSRRRLLLTGTPLQNSVMELWSLMHFLMPDLFRSHAEFKDWFSKPLNAISADAGTEQSNMFQTGIVSKLHNVLRPFLLRRLKSDVEKGLPPKTEHILTCPLSKRQRQLYEDFLSRSDIKETLNSGDFIGVMNVLMQLRKVCNHPDLFEGRPIVSSLWSPRIFFPVPSMSVGVLDQKRLGHVDLALLGLDLASEDERSWPGRTFQERVLALSATQDIVAALETVADDDFLPESSALIGSATAPALLEASRRAAFDRRSTFRRNVLLSELRTRRRGLVGADVVAAVTMTTSSLIGAVAAYRRGRWDSCTDACDAAVRSVEDVADRAHATSEIFTYCFRRVLSQVVEMRYAGDDRQHFADMAAANQVSSASTRLRRMFRSFDVRSMVSLPDARLVQWDCGKLQVLDKLLRDLKRDRHRVLIFTQMTRVLDILESFLNLHAHRYLRLDGATKTDERQRLVERFNTDPRVFCMILTTRAGGLGLNLTGADTVVFYDTDYNPAMDAQAQDRAHRIGQTKPVHIFRLVSERTVEENILKRSQQKRTLESLVISRAGFTTEAFRQRLDVMGLVERESREAAVLTAQVEDVPDLLHSSESVGILKGATAGPTLNSVGRGTSPISRELSAPDSRHVASGTVGKSVGLDLQAAYESIHAGANGTGARLVADPEPPDPHDAQAEADLRSGSDIGCGDADISAALLAADDDAEALADINRKREESMAHAEFDEECPVLDERVAAEPEEDDDEKEDILTSLTPIQRYALMLVEQTHGESGNPSDSSRPSMYEEPRHVGQDANEGLEPYGDQEYVSGGIVRVANGEQLKFGDIRVHDNEVTDKEHGCENGPGEDSEDITDLVYDVGLTDSGHPGYLKVLTDIDADIKVYLPLRDDDPEELKLSNVVNGTAAAGLECAEDAAFFPHAYNRMSRTPYATRRQKEKAAANLAKRLADEKNKGKGKVDGEPAKGVLSAPPDAPVDPKVKTVSKSKSTQPSVTKGNGSVVQPLKRPRSDHSAKTKHSAPSATLAGGPVSNIPSDSVSGLFTKTVKKMKNRQHNSFAAKSVVGQNVSSKEDIGVNDGWSADEEKRLLELVTAYNKNMALVSDALSLDPCVSAGQRIARGQKRCVDRMKSLAKDVKGGPSTSRATNEDMDVMRRHINALLVASRTLQAGPPSWSRNSATSLNEPHPSHVKVVNEVSSRTSGRFPVGPPTLAAVTGLVCAPDCHRPGMKPAECTPAAIAKLRRPFIRPRISGDKVRPLSSGPLRSPGAARGASLSTLSTGHSLGSFSGITTNNANCTTNDNVQTSAPPFNAARFGQSHHAPPGYPSVSGRHSYTSDEQQRTTGRGGSVGRKRGGGSGGSNRWRAHAQAATGSSALPVDHTGSVRGAHPGGNGRQPHSGLAPRVRGGEAMNGPTVTGDTVLPGPFARVPSTSVRDHAASETRPGFVAGRATPREPERAQGLPDGVGQQRA